MSSLSSPDGWLARNLRCLALSNPGLAERLCEPVAGDHVEVLAAKTGIATARFNRIPELWIQAPDDPRGDAEKTVAAWESPDDGPVLCLGVGLGYELKSLLDRLPSERRMIGYERDPWLLRQAFRCHDFSKNILSARLSFLLGTDLADAPISVPLSLFRHPVLGSLYQSENDYLDHRVGEKTSRRAMVVSGGLFVQDVEDALKHSGFSILTWDPRRVSRKESVHQLKRFGPELVFAVNYLAGLPELCRELGIPCVIWEIDPCIERLPVGSNQHDLTMIYTYRKGHVSRYRLAGFSHVEYLPLAANPKRRYPMLPNADQVSRYGATISFVGNSMRDQAKALKKVFAEVCRHNSISDPDQHWDQALGAQQMDLDRDVVRSALARTLSRGNSILADGNGRLVDVAACAAETAASDRRIQLIAALATHGFGISVWGDPGWEEGCSAADYRGWAGHDRELTAIYNASVINLDINRLYQSDIATMRVFDVLACKGFLLADCSSAVQDLFEVGAELVVYRSTKELLHLVEYYLKHEKERDQIAEAGHLRVLRNHTIEQRIAWVLAELG